MIERKHHYDYERGWDGTNVGWHTVQVNPKYHTECVNWLYNNIDNPERHCRWVSFDNASFFRFRYERDFLWFRLTWE